ncbi:hypothetical protein [Streptomyces sp. TRM49041]|uniref:hypothetical protein n=1 Tax=Streptomyces sp. TRM49041 TaxID=2603216 RepID=UPI0011F0906B|nr:hypothetical protein [Streptomyces sp. TRM49041]
MLKMRALPNVPRWAVFAAHAVPLVTLPSGVWRVALGLGVPLAEDGVDVAYAVVLSAVVEGLALLTLGLVRGWGEVVPLPGGWRVPARGAVAVALLGAAGLLAGFGWSGYAVYAGFGDLSVGSPAQDVVFHLCYAPLLAWPLLLIAVTVAYHRRRRPAARP